MVGQPDGQEAEHERMDLLPVPEVLVEEVEHRDQQCERDAFFHEILPGQKANRCQISDPPKINAPKKPRQSANAKQPARKTAPSRSRPAAASRTMVTARQIGLRRNIFSRWLLRERIT